MAATFAHYYSKPPSSVCRLYTLLLSRPASAPGSDLLHAVSQVRDCGTLCYKIAKKLLTRRSARTALTTRGAESCDEDRRLRSARPASLFLFVDEQARTTTCTADAFLFSPTHPALTVFFGDDLRSTTLDAPLRRLPPLSYEATTTISLG